MPGAARALAIMQTAEISATGRAQVGRIVLEAVTSRAAVVETAKHLMEAHADSTGRPRAIAAAAELRAWDREEAEASAEAVAVAADGEGGGDDWLTQRGTD